MADQTIGKLLIQLALEDDSYKKDLVDATKATQTAAAAIGAANADASKTAADAMKGATDAAVGAGKALAKVSDEMLKATGAYYDSAGKLHEANGKFTTAEKLLESVGKAAQGTAEDVNDLGESVKSLDLGELKKSGQELGEQLKSLSTTLRTYIADGFKVAAAAAAGFIAASTYIGANFQQKMTQVGVVAGATGDEMQKLTDKARELGATTAFSASDASDAMNLLAGAGLSVNEVLTATGDALTLAGAGGTTLDQSAQTLTSTMAQFNLTAGEAGRISDVLAKATAKSQFTVSDLGEALKYGGTVGAGFNWSLEQTVAALAQFRDLGIQGGQAGTVLRSAMVGATTASAQNIKVLKEYGLTMEQISPETHSFAEILTTVGKAGVSTSDAMVVFGAEAGAAVATLSRRFAEGGDSYNEMLSDLQNSTGAATQMYADMQKNVAGSFAELQSAVEEVFLTLFDQYSGPLAELIDSLAALVNRVSTEIQNRSFLIKASLLDAFGSITKWIDDNADYIAETIASFIEDAADFATSIKEILPYLSQMIPLLDDIALAMGLIWVVTEVMAFVAALGEVIGALTATGFSLQGLMVILTEATGGIYALVAGIGLLVAGLVALISRYNEAADAAEKLKAAQDELKQGEATATAERGAALQAYLDQNKARLKAEAEGLAASGQVDSARYREIQTLMDLTGSTAAQAEAEGKLVMVRGQLRTVGSIAQDLDPDDVAAFNAEVRNLSNSSAEASKKANELEQAILKAQSVDAGDYGAAGMQSVYLQRVDRTVNTIEEAQAKLQQLREEAKTSNSAAINLQKQYDTATSAMLNEAARNVKKSEDAGTSAKASGTAEKLKLEKQYVDETVSLHEGLLRDLQGIGVSEEESAALKLQEQQENIKESYRKQEESARTYYQGLIDAAKGNAGEQSRLQGEYEAEKVRLEAAMQGDITLVADVAAKERAQKEVDEARKAVAAKEEEERRIYGIINGLEEKALTESQKLAKEKADTLAGIDDQYGAEKARIAADYDKKIAEAQADEAKKAQAEIAKDLKEGMSKAAAAVVAIWKGIVGAIGAVKDAISATFTISADFVSFFSDGLETLTGFSLDLRGIIQGIAEDMADAPTMTLPGGQTVSTGAAPVAAGGAVSSAVEAGVAFVNAAIQAIPAVIDALVKQLPTLIDALVKAIPVILDSVIAALPGLVQMFVEQAPRVIEALAVQIPILIKALVEQLPVIFDTILSMISTIIPPIIEAGKALVMGILQSLPALAIGIVELVPDIISGVLAALPGIITALVKGATQVVVAIITMLPQVIDQLLVALPDIIITLIDSVLEALPLIVEALITAIPEIFVSILTAIPKIIFAVANQVPTIIRTLIGLIPTIITALIQALITALIQALPEVIKAFVTLIPTLVVGMVEAAPEIALALVDGLIIQMPQIIVAMIAEFVKQIPAIAVAIGEAIWEGIKNIAQTIADFFSGLWETITGQKSKESKSDKPGAFEKGGFFDTLLGGDKASAYSGMEYVPATMRVTVHPGEAIIPASRNAMGRGQGRSDPALAGGPQRASGGGGGEIRQLQVLIDGRVVEEVLLDSSQMGRSTGLTRKMRTTAGVKAGLDRGHYNRWNK